MGAGHDHDLTEAFGRWGEWTRRPLLAAVLVVVALGALATAVGVVALWPDGSGSREARAAAEEMGLATDRFHATVESVTDAPCSFGGSEVPCRTITVVPAEGPDVGTPVSLGEYSLDERRLSVDVDVGERIVVGYEASTAFYFYADRDRGTPLVVLAVLFALMVVALARLRGVLALAAMAFTVVLLVGYVAPSVLDGNDPLLVCCVAASAIAFVTLYLTHGFSPGTTVALAGTLSALALTLALSWVFFGLSRFTGLATEEGVTLPFLTDLDLPSLLLGGAILGALGALDDVTVTQVATVAELHHRDPTLRRRDLVASGLRVGREHIAATVNTLLLAYVGASLTLVLLFAVSDQSLGMIANSEIVAIEIVRTLCGSIGLVAAVPVTTALAAALAGWRSNPGVETGDDEPPSAPVDAASWPEALAAAADEPPHRDAAPSWDAFAPRDDLEI